MNRERRIPTFVNNKLNESNNLQNIITKYEFYNIKSKYLQKLINKTLDDHEKRFSYDFSECNYDLSLRDNYGFEMHASIYPASHIKNHSFIREIAESGYNFRMIRELTILSHISIKYINPEY